MKTLKITPPEGCEVDKDKSTFEEIVFKKIDTEAKTWDEIQEQNRKLKKEQWYLTNYGDIYETKAKVYDLHLSKNHVPDKRAAEKILALCQMYIIADHYNKGWKRDSIEWCYSAIWDNEDDKIKPITLFNLSDTMPVFKSKEILLEAYENNKEIFETALKP